MGGEPRLDEQQRRRRHDRRLDAARARRRPTSARARTARRARTRAGRPGRAAPGAPPRRPAARRAPSASGWPARGRTRRGRRRARPRRARPAGPARARRARPRRAGRRKWKSRMPRAAPKRSPASGGDPIRVACVHGGKVGPGGRARQDHARGDPRAPGDAQASGEPPVTPTRHRRAAASACTRFRRGGARGAGVRADACGATSRLPGSHEHRLPGGRGIR